MIETTRIVVPRDVGVDARGRVVRLAQAGIVRDESLMLDLRFDERGGDALHDRSGGGHDAAVHAVLADFWDAPVGAAFDGVDDYVSGPSDELDLTRLTAEIWVYADAVPSNEPGLIGRDASNWQLSHYSNGLVYFYVAGSAGNVNAAMSAGQWHHVVGTYDQAMLRLYLDGVQKNYNAKTDPIPQGSGKQLRLGRWYSYYFAGRIGEARVYDRALSAAEVRQNYESTRGRYE